MTETKQLYNRYYKYTILLPAAFLIFSLFYLMQFNAANGDLIYKDVSLTGGTTITVLDSNVNSETLKESLKDRFPDVAVRQISDLRTGSQKGLFIETVAEAKEVKTALEDELGYSLTQENSSIEFSGATLSQGFYQQLRLAILLAFLFMAIVVFIIFRSLIPSFAVILSAFADIIMTVVVVDLLGISVSIAGIIAFLMLIGYSVDTDILLTTRVLRRSEGSVNERIYGAFKTGMIMTITSIAAVLISLFIISPYSEVLRQIFTILSIGLAFDIVNTWLTNAPILKWHVERKGAQK